MPQVACLTPSTSIIPKLQILCNREPYVAIRGDGSHASALLNAPKSRVQGAIFCIDHGVVVPCTSFQKGFKTITLTDNAPSFSAEGNVVAYNPALVNDAETGKRILIPLHVEDEVLFGKSWDSCSLVRLRHGRIIRVGVAFARWTVYGKVHTD